MIDRIPLDSLTSDHLDALYERAEQAETERDGAYRERAHLVALLAALTPGAVIAPASDIDEPGWQIAYLTIGDRQASWHIAPRDALLFADIEHVTVDDPRAQWDGHTTEEKYDHIATHATALMAKEDPSMPTTPCTATIDGVNVPHLETLTCTEDRTGHGPNHIGPPRQYGRLLWTDHHAGATPHKES